MSNVRFNPNDFGLKGKNLALVDLGRISDALTYIFQNANDDLLKILKQNHKFGIIPVVVQKPGLNAKKMAVVDADKAEKAFKFIRDNADPALLSALRAEFEFELMPVVNNSSKHGGNFIYRLGKKMLVLSLLMLVLVKMFGGQ